MRWVVDPCDEHGWGLPAKSHTHIHIYTKVSTNAAYHKIDHVSVCSNEALKSRPFSTSRLTAADHVRREAFVSRRSRQHNPCLKRDPACRLPTLHIISAFQRFLGGTLRCIASRLQAQTAENACKSITGLTPLIAAFVTCSASCLMRTIKSHTRCENGLVTSQSN
jgi:hypothetical protein